MWILALIVVLVIGAVGLALWSRARFESSVAERVEAITASGPVRARSFEHLPGPMRAYVERAGLKAGESHRWARLTQDAVMKLSPEGEWQALKAQQWYAVDRPAFVWKPEMKLPVGSMVGVDRLDLDEGRLQMRIFGMIPVADEGGPVAMKAQLLRYLSELPWVPAAIATNPALRFEMRNERRVRVRASLRCGREVVSAWIDFDFDEAGDIIEARTEARPWKTDDGFVDRPWGGEFSDYATRGGVRMPTHAAVYWDLPEGRYYYWKGDVKSYERG